MARQRKLAQQRALTGEEGVRAGAKRSSSTGGDPSRNHDVERQMLDKLKDRRLHAQQQQQQQQQPKDKEKKQLQHQQQKEAAAAATTNNTDNDQSSEMGSAWSVNAPTTTLAPQPPPAAAASSGSDSADSTAPAASFDSSPSPASTARPATTNKVRRRKFSLDSAVTSMVNGFSRLASRKGSSDGESSNGGAGGTGDNPIRYVRGLFSVSNTSSKEPPAILAEIERVLVENGIEFSVDGWVVSCTEPTSNPKAVPIRFEIEVCGIPRLSLFGLHLKRLSGDTWPYKRLCHRLMSNMNL